MASVARFVRWGMALVCIASFVGTAIAQSAMAAGQGRGDAEEGGRRRPKASVEGAARAAERSAAERERAGRGPIESGSPNAANPPVVPNPADAAHAEVEAQKARVAEMQALSEAHVQELNRVSEEFQARVRTAQTPAERGAILQELKRVQTEKNAEFQRRMLELKNRP